MFKLAEFPCQVLAKLLTSDLRHALLNAELLQYPQHKNILVGSFLARPLEKICYVSSCSC